MRNRSRKILMLIAVVIIAMVCFAFSASAATQGYYTYEVTDGEATITKVDTSISGEVVIPDILGGYPVTAVGEYAFLNNEGITKVTIPESVTIIGKAAFAQCSQLKSVEIPDSVTTIKESVFMNCKNLESIVIPDSVTSSIGESAFRNCDNLHNVIIGNNVTGIDDSAFSQSESLYSVTIGNKVEYIGEYAFNSCGFSGIIIPNSVKSIGEAAFYQCSNLSDLIILNGVTNIESAAFMYCSNLGDVVLPDSVISLDSTAFSQSGITSLTIGKNVKEISSSGFNDYTKLESIQVDENNLYFSSKDGVLFNKNKTELICYPRYKGGSYTIPNGVINIAGAAFEYCDYLTEIIIPDSVETIGGGAFYYCYNLGNIKLGTGLKRVERAAFDCCYSIANVHFSGTQEQWNEIDVSVLTNLFFTDMVHISADSDGNGYCDECGYPVVHAHSYISVITPPTCTAEGYTTYNCSCGDSYVAEYVEAKGHSHVASVTPPTCTAEGYTTYNCSCGDSYISDYIVATGHSYGDDGICKDCDDYNAEADKSNESDSGKNCSHICHKTGFMGFIWKILLFIFKLFKISPVCDCGVAHY